MSRLLDRMTSQHMNWRGLQKLWQRVCEQIEELFASVNEAIGEMTELVPITISADYTGAIYSGQLPRNITVRRTQGSSDVTTDSEWSFAVESGSISGSIAPGVFTLTDVGSSAVVVITSTYLGVAKTRRLSITKNLGATPSTGSGGGGASSDSAFSSINSASMAAISDELTVTVGSGGTVNLTAPLSVWTAEEGPVGVYPVYGIWRWWNGASWEDLGAEVVTSSNVEVSREDSVFVVTNGSLNVPASKTGLTPSASEKFQLYARNDSGTRTMYFTGTASAVGS